MTLDKMIHLFFDVLIYIWYNYSINNINTMTTDIPTSTLWAHASTLMKLRAKSLQAYGIDPRDLAINNPTRSLIELPESKTRSLAKIAKNSRALAIESEHAIVLI